MQERDTIIVCKDDLMRQRRSLQLHFRTPAYWHEPCDQRGMERIQNCLRILRTVRGSGAARCLLALGALSLASCVTTPSDLTFRDMNVPRPEANPDSSSTLHREPSYSYWDDEMRGGSLRVSIDLSEQTAYFYRGSTKIGRSRVATGLPGHRTPTGSFSILNKTYDKHSNLYGRIVDGAGNVVVRDADVRRDSVPPGGRFVGASMPYWMRLTSSGIGMHAGPIPDPGYPASHGCIRLPREIARQLYRNSSVGTPVEIVP